MQTIAKITTPFILFVLTACGGGGGGSSTTTAPTTPATTTFTVGGTVSGLPAGATVSLQDNGGDTITVSSNTAFTFPTALSSGQTYLATVSSSPTGYTCIAQNNSGSVTANVSNISFTCSAGQYSSVSSNLSQNVYPVTYSTIDNNPNSNVCNIDTSKESYPQNWNGSQGLPTISGAPLNSNLKTAVYIKDILPSGSLPNTCTNPDNLTEFNRTLTRLHSLNVDLVNIEQWHWAQVNTNGSFTILGDANDALSDAQLARYVSAAHAAGFKVMMTNQIQGFVDSTGTNNIATPTGNAQNYQLWVSAFSSYMLNRATYFQTLGVDYWEMGCNGCVYGDAGDNSSAALSVFIPAYEAILPQVSAIYTGKRYIFGNTSILTPTILSNVDYISAGMWNNSTYTASTEASVNVSSYKANLNSSTPALLQYNKPLIADVGIQSRSNSLSVPGYEEETECTNSIGVIAYSSSCIQQQTTTDFSIQAIVIEAELEFLSAQNLPSGSIVRVSDYWQTDFMNQNGQGPTFPNIGSTIRNKPAEAIVGQWFAR